MSEEIVRRLRNRSPKDMNYLKESMSRFRVTEAEDDEDEDIPEEDLPSIDDEEIPEDDVDTSEDAPEEKETAEEEPPEEEKPEPQVPDNPNPLDNMYAINHSIGDPVTIAYANGTNSFLRGEIEGYDKEGFYRVKWEDGMTTNGITDIAISDIIGDSKCVCGSTDFIQEGKNLVCDKCGRHIRENMDPLQKADKSRPKGKKMIRSEAHPVSTAVKPSISEAIKDIFKNSASIREDVDEEEDDSPGVFFPLEKLRGEFWTRLPELVDDIEELGFIVEESNSEYVLVSAEDGDASYALQIPIAGTSRTMVLDLDKAHKV